jgi:hypothetical protein
MLRRDFIPSAVVQLAAITTSQAKVGGTSLREKASTDTVELKRRAVEPGRMSGASFPTRAPLRLDGVL